MARKRRGGRHGFRVGKYVNIAFKIMGLAVAAGPAVQSIDMSNPKNIPKNLLFNYTGFNLDDGSLNTSRTGVGIGSLIGGVLIAKIGSFLGRRF